VSRPSIDKGAAPVLGADHVAFLSGAAISSALAARDASNQPSLANALGVRVQPDQRVLEVFVDGERASELLRDLRSGSPVALVSSEPKSHRTIQVKGPRADIGPLAQGDEAFVASRVDAIVKHIVPLGYYDAALRAYFAFTPAALLKVVFTATAAFLQTPGPGAGAPLKP
jgi:hypothetical protein